MKLKSLSYVLGWGEDIEVGNEYFFGQLWDGNGEGEELLDSGAISPDNENVVWFKIVCRNRDILKTIVRVTDIF